MQHAVELLIHTRAQLTGGRPVRDPARSVEHAYQLHRILEIPVEPAEIVHVAAGLIARSLADLRADGPPSLYRIWTWAFYQGAAAGLLAARRRYKENANAPSDRSVSRKSPSIRTETYRRLVGYRRQVGSTVWVPDTRRSRAVETVSEFHRLRRELTSTRLKHRMDELGVTQYQLAKLLKTRHSQVWDWVHAEHAPSERWLRRLEAALDVPPGYFTADDEQCVA